MSLVNTICFKMNIILTFQYRNYYYFSMFNLNGRLGQKLEDRFDYKAQKIINTNYPWES